MFPKSITIAAESKTGSNLLGLPETTGVPKRLWAATMGFRTAPNMSRANTTNSLWSLELKQPQTAHDFISHGTGYQLGF